MKRDKEYYLEYRRKKREEDEKKSEEEKARVNEIEIERRMIDDERDMRRIEREEEEKSREREKRRECQRRKERQVVKDQWRKLEKVIGDLRKNNRLLRKRIGELEEEVRLIKDAREFYIREAEKMKYMQREKNRHEKMRKNDLLVLKEIREEEEQERKERKRRRQKVALRKRKREEEKEKEDQKEEDLMKKDVDCHQKEKVKEIEKEDFSVNKKREKIDEEEIEINKDIEEKDAENLRMFNSDDFDGIVWRKLVLALLHYCAKRGMSKVRSIEKVSAWTNISCRTLYRWDRKFTKNGYLTRKQHGGGPVWILAREDLQREARKWCRKNMKRGFTAQDFLKEYLWKNEETNKIRRVETARVYLKRLGFRYGEGRNATYIDGHEREDVKRDRKQFCDLMMELFADEKVIFVAQDESIYHSKDGVKKKWIEDGASCKKKGQGKGIMVSAFMDHDGILSLTEEEWKKGKETNPNLCRQAVFYLKFGKEWGYYEYSKFQKDITSAIEIALLKYPQKNVIFLFDNSSVHQKKGDDALDAHRMNLNPGGNQPIFRNTIFHGKEQTFADANGKAKGARTIAIERGFDVRGMKKDEVVALLASCEDFRSETCMLEKMCENFGITCLFFPKFHCEFNWCELIWANSKRFCQVKCSENLPALEKIIPLSFANIPCEVYLKTYQHALEEIRAAHEDGELIEIRKKFKSHRPPVGQIPHKHLLINID